jgi:hypothetical protein
MKSKIAAPRARLRLLLAVSIAIAGAVIAGQPVATASGPEEEEVLSARLVNVAHGRCLANHHPKVFLYNCGNYTDQQWSIHRSGYRRDYLYNLDSEKCLAMHDNGHVFTHPCNGDYLDQRWHLRDDGYIENNAHGLCLAAHPDNKVFGWRCGQNDQIWRWR